MRKLATLGTLLVAILDLVGATRVVHWLAPQSGVTVLRGSASADNMDFSQMLKGLSAKSASDLTWLRRPLRSTSGRAC